MSINEISIAVTGEATYIESLINSISSQPEDLITHGYQAQDTDTKQVVQIHCGRLLVDDKHRIDFFGSHDEGLFEFIKTRPHNKFNGLIIILNADDAAMLDGIKDVLAEHKNYLQKHALVVAVSGQDYKMIKQAEEQIRQALGVLNSVAPVFSIDPESKEEVSLLVESLLCSANPGINNTSSGQ